MNGQLVKIGKELTILTWNKKEEIFDQLFLAMEAIPVSGSLKTDSLWGEISEAEKKIRNGEVIEITITRGNVSFVFEPWRDTVGIRRL